jgi:hypothetical protein
MKTVLSAAAVLLGLIAAAPASSQLALELRGGAGAGSYGATGAGFQLLPHPAGSASLSYAFGPRLAAYAGYGFVRFGCEEGLCVGAEPVFTSQGVDVGLRVRLPAGLWVRGGAVMHTLEGSGARGSESSDAAFGIGAGAGIGVPLGDRLTLTPGIGYTRYTASVAGGDETVAIVTGDVGLRFSLSGPRR